MEDKILTDYIKANGEGKWRNLPKKAGHVPSLSLVTLIARARAEFKLYFAGHVVNIE